jgi:hypothetical protein
MSKFSWWPWMLKSEHEDVRRENWTLKNALREANEELRKHRLLINGLKEGRIGVTRSFEKAISNG